VPFGALGALLGDQKLGQLLLPGDPARHPLHVGHGVGGKRNDGTIFRGTAHDDLLDGLVIG
jgi:hypothetical protein